MEYRRKRQSDKFSGVWIRQMNGKAVHMGGLILVGILWIIIELIKSACEPTIPADNWKNICWGVFDKDTKTIQKNLRNGKYK